MARETKRNLRPSPQVPFRRIEGMEAADPKLRDVLHRMQQHVAEATKPARDSLEVRARTVTVRLRPPDSSNSSDKGEPPTWPVVHVAHGLGRTPKGWKITARRGTGDATVRDRVQSEDDATKSETSSKHSARELLLTASGTDADPVVELDLSIW